MTLPFSEELIEGLREGNSAKVEEFFRAMSAAYFKKNSFGGYWYSDNNAWQRPGGYNNLYDEVFELGEAIKVSPHRKFMSTFDYKGKEWRIEGWMGTYMQLGVGAEIGVYYRDYDCGSNHYKSVPDKDRLNIKWTLYKNDPTYSFEEIVLERGMEPTWWLVGFRPDAGTISKDKLYLKATIEFKDNEMATAFINGFTYGEKTLDLSFSSAVEKIVNKFCNFRNENLKTIKFDDKSDITIIKSSSRGNTHGEPVEVQIIWGNPR